MVASLRCIRLDALAFNRRPGILTIHFYTIFIILPFGPHAGRLAIVR